MKPDPDPLLPFFRSAPLDNNQIHLLHDDAGKILEVFNEKENRHAAIIRELRQAGTLKDYYDFLNPPQSAKPLRRAAARHFRHTPFFQNMYSLLPMSFLVSAPVRPGQFLGRIVFYALEPNVSSPSLFGVLYVEPGSERLLAFNDYVRERLCGRNEPPETYLGRPMSGFLSPTPSEFQAMHLPSADPETGSGWKDLPDRFEVVPGRIPLKREGRAFTLENTLNEPAYLTLLESADTRSTDFVLAVEFERLKGAAPFFTVGGRAGREDESPDEHGYLLGSSGMGEGVVLKRIGLLTEESAHPLPAGERLQVRLCKIGHSVALYCGQKRLLAFYDPDFKHSPATFLSMGVRPGAGVRVRSISFRARPCRPQEGEAPAKHIVQISGHQGAFYALDRFFNYFIGHTEYGRAGQFLLYDVTELEGRIRSLSDRYRLQLRREKEMKSLLDSFRGGGSAAVGSGKIMSDFKATARTLAASNAAVLIEGETGSGKEVIARYIHVNSPRKGRPFIKVDCATVPPGLIESHLFGHEKGAFTGAISQSIGVFEKAQGGTLFLDEVGNLTPEVQAKLLRFFNDYAITRIGSSVPIPIDVRCIAASNEDLEQKVKQGLFREDLFFRINVLKLAVPSLKERIEDMEELCDHFIREMNLAEGKSIKGLSEAALLKLKSHAWPGNVRELRNVIQRAAIFCTGETITEDLIHLPAATARKRGRGRFLFTDPEVVRKSLTECHGVVADAARAMNVSKVAMYAYLKRRGIRPDDFRQGHEIGPG